MVNCKDCIYWFNANNTPDTGECRRSNPYPLVQAGEMKFVGYYNFRSIWPYTRSIDWCGKGESSEEEETEQPDVTITDQEETMAPISFHDMVFRAIKTQRAK